MKYEFYNTEYDFDDDVELYFLHERMLHHQYMNMKDARASEERVDRYTRVFYKDLDLVWNKRVNTGGIEWARPTVQSYNGDLFELVSRDYTMCWKKTDGTSDTLVIHLTSFAGHEGRLTAPLTSVSDKIINLDTDLLVVNEDPFRMPEILYPSMMVLGVSDTCDTLEKTCEQMRTYIKREYKNILFYADSKHAGTVVAMAHMLADLKPTVLVTGGQTSYNWDTSPWVREYVKWYHRPDFLNYQEYHFNPVAVMHIVKCYKFKQMGVSEQITDPYKYADDYDVPIHFYYGKYDSDYAGFKEYVRKLNKKNVKMYEVDYKISEAQTHNIKPYIERKILSGYTV